MQLEVTITKHESERSVSVEHSKTIETLRAELKSTARQVHSSWMQAVYSASSEAHTHAHT